MQSMIFFPSNFKGEIPKLRGENYKVLKEIIFLHSRSMDIGYSIQKDEPPSMTVTRLADDVDLYEIVLV